MDTKKEIEGFIKRLKEQLSDNRKKRDFHREHNFKREVEYYRYRIEIIEEIIFKLEFVMDGHLNGSDITFDFDKNG